MKDDILNNLIKLFSKLPSLGPRSARRVVLHILNNKDKVMMPLIESMKENFDKIKKCPICFNFTTNDTCDICNDLSRDRTIICVVETVADLWAIENASIYKGCYHVLGGYLSASEGISPTELNIDTLISRIKSDENIKEIILASNPTIEGQTTAFYIADILKQFPNLKITKPANGIPLGSELNYLDESTLDIAFKNKNNF